LTLRPFTFRGQAPRRRSSRSVRECPKCRREHVQHLPGPGRRSMEALSSARTWVSGCAEVTGGGCATPAVPAQFLHRERLEAKLCGVVGRCLTVVTGVAGAGKSVLLTGWAGGRGAGMTAWVGLEPADNDSRRFWGRLAGALRDLGREVATRVPDVSSST